MKPLLFGSILQRFFAVRLIRQVGASPHTIASYRDTFRLLLAFAQSETRKKPSALLLSDINAALVGRFLTHLEHSRKNSVRTRNVRAAAIRSLFSYAALEEPAKSAMIQQVLAIPNKRHARRQLPFLTEREVDALLTAPDLGSWSGRRDRALFLLMVETGLRASEATGLKRRDLVLGRASHVCCHGKGRKERTTPLQAATRKVLQSWLAEREQRSETVLFPSACGARLSTDGLAYLLRKHVATAGRACSTIREKRVSPHTLRHTAAMRLVHGGVDRAVIALWLGHESVESTDAYFHGSLELKEKALARTQKPASAAMRFRATDELLAFLERL